MAGLIKRGKTWYIVVQQDGRERRRSLRTTDRRRAERLRAAFEAQTAPKVRIANPGSPDAFWFAYTAAVTGRKHPDSIAQDKITFDAFVAFAQPAQMSDVTAADVESWLKKRAAAGTAPRTLNTAIKRGRMLWNHARRFGMVPGNPWQEIPFYREVKRRVRVLTLEQIDTWLQIAQSTGPRVHLFIALGCFAGFRKREIVWARWEWIDWESELIHVWSRGRFTPKGYRERAVPLHADLVPILRQYQAAASGPWIIPEKPNRTAGKSHRYRTEVKKSFAHVAKKAGTQWVTPHVLRHTFASQLLQAGHSLLEVAEWMGHSLTRTTELYAHFVPRTGRITFRK